MCGFQRRASSCNDESCDAAPGCVGHPPKLPELAGPPPLLPGAPWSDECGASGEAWWEEGPPAAEAELGGFGDGFPCEGGGEGDACAGPGPCGGDGCCGLVAGEAAWELTNVLTHGAIAEEALEDAAEPVEMGPAVWSGVACVSNALKRFSYHREI